MTESDVHSAMQDPAVRQQVARLRRRSLRDAIIGWSGASLIIALLVLGWLSAIAPVYYTNSSVTLGAGISDWVVWVAWNSGPMPGAVRWGYKYDGMSIDINYQSGSLVCRFKPPAYWHFHHDAFQWTNFVAAPVWSFALLVLLAALFLLRGAFRRRRWNDRGMCVACGYDLTGNPSSICPECAMPKAH